MVKKDLNPILIANLNLIKCKLYQYSDETTQLARERLSNQIRKTLNSRIKVKEVVI
jgi:hypothetical protein